MPSMTNEWVIAKASVQGKSHVDGGIVNQDAMCMHSPPGDTCFSIAISDGAGSAKRADEGSQHFSREIAHGLHKLVTGVHRKEIAGNSQNAVTDCIQQIIADARRSLHVGTSSLRDFHCNLMALAMGPTWGVVVYLGDAVMLKSGFVSSAKGADFFVNASMSVQDRSEYANETHFLTEPDWSKHLEFRIVDPNGADDFFALMTDGAADIALRPVPGSTQKRVDRAFFAPLVSMVMTAPGEAERNMVIKDALASPKTYKLTGDDKTMALVIRRSKLSLGALEPVVEDQNPLDETGTATQQVTISPPKTTAVHLPIVKPVLTSAVSVRTSPDPHISQLAKLAPVKVPNTPISSKLKHPAVVVAITLVTVFVVAIAAFAGYVHITRTPKDAAAAGKAGVGTATTATAENESKPALPPVNAGSNTPETAAMVRPPASSPNPPLSNVPPPAVVTDIKPADKTVKPQAAQASTTKGTASGASSPKATAVKPDRAQNSSTAGTSVAAKIGEKISPSAENPAMPASGSASN